MTERRSFLARLAAAAAAAGLGSPSLQAQAPSPPARHAKDDWFDQLPGKHRMFFDTTSPRGAEDGAIYVNNFFTANKNGYGLDDGDLAVVLGFRHNSIGFAFDDATWAKYGAAIAENAKFTDPKTGKAPATNLRRQSYEALAKRGVHFAICDLSAHRLAGVIARAVGSTLEDIYKELVPHAVGGSAAHFVPAGIVAVNRSQERGYSIAYVG